jgi:hypothetical protein
LNGFLKTDIGASAAKANFVPHSRPLCKAQRKSGFRPLWQNETRKLEVFGSFPGLSLTGEMRTPLDSKQVLLFALEIWFLLLFLVPLVL